jgi:type IV secretion system protein VirD4
MGGGHFMKGMQGFMALHRQTLEADYAEASRLEAARMERRIETARASGRLGNGRLADIADLERRGHFKTDGIFLGGFQGRLLFYNGDAPLLSYAMTGSGKGRDLILPNLAHLRDRSLFVLDQKDGENAFASAAHRTTLGAGCIFLNPCGLHGFPNTRINPLQLLVNIVKSGGRIDTEAVEAAQILLPTIHNDPNSWVRSGAVRMVATRAEYLAHFEPECCTLSNIWRFVNADAEQMNIDFAMMRTCGIEATERKSAAIHDTAGNAPKQFEAYKSDAIDALSPFEPGKVLADATDGHEFDFSVFKHKPTTAFLMMPSEKNAAAYMSLIVNYVIETIARERGPIRTTLILDEFPQLNRANSVLKALQVYRGKGIQPWIFSQGRFSMEERWPRNIIKEFEDQSAVMTMKYVRDPDLLRDVELWSGNTTILMPGVSHSGGIVNSAGANLGEAKRPVLQSEDIIGRPELLIRFADLPHIVRADSVPFYAVDPWHTQIGDVRNLHRGVSQ